MLEVIAQATRWIHFENYIIRSDKAGQWFADALIARARDGISVRVMYDAFGSSSTKRRYWRSLREGGCRRQGLPSVPASRSGRQLLP